MENRTDCQTPRYVIIIIVVVVNSTSQVLREKLKVLGFHINGIRRFVIMFRKPADRPHPPTLVTIHFIFSSQIHPCLSSGLFPPIIPKKYYVLRSSLVARLSCFCYQKPYFRHCLVLMHTAMRAGNLSHAHAAQRFLLTGCLSASNWLPHEGHNFSVHAQMPALTAFPWTRGTRYQSNVFVALPVSGRNYLSVQTLCKMSGIMRAIAASILSFKWFTYVSNFLSTQNVLHAVPHEKV